MIFDADAKERELRAEAESWDTSQPEPARPGDVPVVDVRQPDRRRSLLGALLLQRHR